MKKVVFLSLFFFLSIALFGSDLLINEFVVTPTSAEALEIKNISANTIDLSNYQLVIAGSSWADTFALPTDTLVSGGLYVLDSANVAWTSLPNEGATLMILLDSTTVEDSVGYGSFGGAPAPIYQYSTARISDTGDNAVDFNMDPTPTMGSANDAPVNALGTGNVYINEVYPDTVNGDADQFIELKNFGSGPEDISGYIIYVDDDYTIPSGTIVDANGLFYLPHANFPQYMHLDESYDNVYLMNSNGERVDQMGFSYYHPDTSYGVWGNDTARTVFTGFSFGTSTDFHYMTPTPNAQNPNQTGIISTLAKSKDNAVKVTNAISNGEITVFYTIKKSNPVSIKVFDLAGNCIKTLVPDVRKAAGIYGVNWKTNGANGMYLIRAKIGNETFTKKILLSK